MILKFTSSVLLTFWMLTSQLQLMATILDSIDKEHFYHKDSSTKQNYWEDYLFILCTQVLYWGVLCKDKMDETQKTEGCGSMIRKMNLFITRYLALDDEKFKDNPKEKNKKQYAIIRDIWRKNNTSI